MPRMTRAALRAQQTDEPQDIDNIDNFLDEKDLHPDVVPEADREPRQLRKTRSKAQIHEDQEEVEVDIQSISVHQSPVREALRDITDENYPQADGVVEVTREFEKPEEVEAQPHELRKSTKTRKGKAKGRTKKKTSGPTPVEPEDGLDQDEAEELATKPATFEVSSEAQFQQDLVEADEGEYPSGEADPEAEPVFAEDITSEPGPAIEEVFDYDAPRFDPAIHPPPAHDSASATEDSFLSSIRSRSPAKSLNLTQTQSSNSANNSLQALTPLRRTSSTNFEQSFEAMDSLEDSIEQLTAGLPLLPAGQMHSSPDSPAKLDRRPLRPSGTATPNTSVARTPKSTNKLQTVLGLQDKNKENNPPLAGTPLSKHKTPLKSKTPTTKQSSPLKTRSTPAVKRDPPTNADSAAVRKTSTNTNNRVVSARVNVLNAASSASVSNNKPATSLTRKPSTKQPLNNTTNTKSEVLPKRSTMLALADSKAHRPSMSYSGSPAKHNQANSHVRRVTSGGILSTAKPGFVPTKSSKPPTISTFKLPGEVIAEKLKAQKEAREQKLAEGTSSKTVAEQKAAKMKADREAREERVRQNQLKDQELRALAKTDGTDAEASKRALAEQKAAKLKAEREAREERVRQNQLRDQEARNQQKTDSVDAEAAKRALAEQKAAKLKADREAREERVRQNQMKALEAEKENQVPAIDPEVAKRQLADQKAAKLKAERAAREERVRHNQQKAEEAKAERQKSAKPILTSTLNISKARAEAAERGRQASKEWAEKMMKKKQVEASPQAATPVIAGAA